MERKVTALLDQLGSQKESRDSSPYGLFGESKLPLIMEEASWFHQGRRSWVPRLCWYRVVGGFWFLNLASDFICWKERRYGRLHSFQLSCTLPRTGLCIHFRPVHGDMLRLAEMQVVSWEKAVLEWGWVTFPNACFSSWVQERDENNDASEAFDQARLLRRAIPPACALSDIHQEQNAQGDYQISSYFGHLAWPAFL